MSAPGAATAVRTLARRHIGVLALLAFLVGAVLLGRAVRARMDVDFSADSLQSFVLGLGLAAPVLYVAMVTFRQFLLLPSMLVLTAGGLVFGAAAGTALGGLGILLSAVFGFSVARLLGREWVRQHLGERFRAIERRGERVGLAVVALVTGHPMGVMTPFHWGAGFSSISLVPFVGVVGATALVRAFAYSFFGSALLEPGSRVYWATAILLVVALLPLAFRGVRGRWLSN